MLSHGIPAHFDCSFSGRSLLVFAHADDETIALGARLDRLQIARLIHMTDGAPQDERDSRANGFSSLEAYRQARAAELHRMLAVAGIPETRCENFGVPDQQAALHLAEVASRIAEAIAAERPEILFTHPCEGGHPDHDACAFAVQHAVAMSGHSPLVIECAFYHAGPEGIETGCFLPHSGPETVVCRLHSEEMQQKQALLACFATQQETLRYFPLDQESFREAPAYDFGQPPHAGQLFYEKFPWGMTGERFRQRAEEAEAALRAKEVAAGCR